MTENEAINVLGASNKHIKMIPVDGKDTLCYSSEMVCALEMAEKALEEIQQYREIGLTPTMVKDLIASEKKAHKIALENADMLDEYRAIGTVEKVSKLNELYDKAKWLLDDEQKKRKSFEAIGTIEEFKDLKEKNTKKRFNIFESHGMRQFVCGCCDRPILTTDNYCSFCGQKLDWKGGE